jgi:hypothetical protein
MKPFIIALSLLVSVAAIAASAEQTYFAARDRAIARLTALSEAGKLDDAPGKLHDEARRDLAKLLQPIIGRVAIKGFSTDAQSNIDTLVKGDESFGLLDGLVYASADDKSHVIVTTSALLDRWLKEHKNWWGPSVANVPQQAAAALKSEPFYTQAVSTDAAFVKFLELPVTKPAKATFAFAMLNGRSQDRPPQKPDEIMAAVVQGTRVFIASAPAGTPVEPIPACEDARRDFEKKSAAARDAYLAAERKDEKLYERSVLLERDGDAAALRCFAQRAKNEAFYAPLMKQAQELVDLLMQP